MMRKWPGLRVVSLLGLFLLSLGLSPVSARPSETTGVTAKTIKIGGIFAKLQAGSAVALPILQGYELGFKQINDRGGVLGRKIDYITENDNYDPQQTLPAAKRLVQNSGVFAFAGVFGSDDSNQVLPYLESEQIPFFDPIGGGADVKGKHWVWQSEPSYAREGKVMGTYMARKLHARKVAFVYQVGVNESELAAVKSRMAAVHGDVLAVPYGAQDVDLSKQVARVQQYGPDIIVLAGTLIPTSSFLRLAVATGLKPRLGFFANYPQGDPTWVNLASGGAEGALVTSYADLTGKNKVAAAYRAALKKYGGKYTNYGLYGYFNANLFVRALKYAGKNPTRSSLQRAFDTKFRKYKSGFTGILNWTPTYRFGVTQFKVYRIHKLSFIPLTGWLSS